MHELLFLSFCDIFLQLWLFMRTAGVGEKRDVSNDARAQRWKSERN